MVSRELRGFGPIGLLAIAVILAGNLVVVPVSAILVLVWARVTETPLGALGFRVPKRWMVPVAAGIVLGFLLEVTMKAVVMPLLGAPALNPQFQYLAGNVAALPAILYAVVVGAGFGEETVFRGFLFERVSRAIGPRRVAPAVTVLLTSVVFAAAHYYEQGFFGAAQAAVTGVAFGAMYAATKQLWLPMVAHVAFDLTAVALIFWQWESTVARYFFS